MKQDKWDQLVARIKDEFEIMEHESDDGEIEGENIETLIFNGPAGEMKLERSTHPRVVGERTMYSRLGGDTVVEKVYSDSETVDVVKLYTDQNGEWEELDISALG